MAEEHWFDALSRELINPVPRRAALRSAATFAAGLLLGIASTATSAKKKKKKKPKKSPKKTPQKTTQCGQAACAANFETTKDRDFCEVKCRRCMEAGTNFCIIEGDPSDPAKIATCCYRGDECCAGERGGECCSPPSKCCPGVGCINEDLTCCPDDSTLGACYPGETCCPGAGCANTFRNPSHCGGCGNACPNGQSCIYGACIQVRTCPARTVPCGGPTIWEPEHCCEVAACFGCESVADPGNPGSFRSQCVYRCVDDQVCVDDGRLGVCCLPFGSGCNPSNVGRGFCCSGRCERDEASGGNRCM